MRHFGTCFPRRGRTLAVLALAGALTSPAVAQDPWWGRDKALHLSVSAAVGLGLYGSGALILEGPPERAAFAAGITAWLGLTKEIADAARGGVFSPRDLLWDVVGTGLGVLLGFVIDRLVRRPDRASAVTARFHAVW